MRLFRKKCNVLGIIVIAGVFASFYLGEIFTFTLAQKIAVIVVMALAVLIIALCHERSEEDIIEDNDERNRYIEMKCAAEGFKTASRASFLTIACSLIFFGLTREIFFIWLLAGAAVPYGIMKISMIIFAFKYDR